MLWMIELKSTVTNFSELTIFRCFKQRFDALTLNYGPFGGSQQRPKIIEMRLFLFTTNSFYNINDFSIEESRQIEVNDCVVLER